MKKAYKDQSSQGNIPFSWENKPGVRKDYDHHKSLAGEEWRVVVERNSSVGEGRRVVVDRSSSAKEGGRLPPPPCENSNKAATCPDLGLPLPPCVFQPHLRSSSSRRVKDDDPFLMAFKECTKSNKKSSLMMRKNSFLGSCKYSCSVRDDSIVRVSHAPMSISEGKTSAVVKRQG